MARASWVYFIRRGTNGGVKIGYAENPHSRMRGMQTANEDELFLLGAIKGGREVEQELHRRFATGRKRGEWFHATPELLAFIEGVTRSQEQPEDPGEADDWPFTEEQAEWMRGYIAAELESRWHENAQGLLNSCAPAFIQPLTAVSLRENKALVDCLLVADATMYEHDNPDDPMNRGLRAGRSYFAEVDPDSLSEARDRMQDWHAADMEPGIPASPEREASWPLDAGTVDWLRGFLAVGESVTDIFTGAVNKASVEERDENWRRLDRKVAIAREVGFPHHVAGIECALRWYNVLQKRPARLRPQPDESVEPEEPVDLSAALNTIMLGIGGDGS